jgi:hypothetical protein
MGHRERLSRSREVAHGPCAVARASAGTGWPEVELHVTARKELCWTRSASAGVPGPVAA